MYAWLIRTIQIVVTKHAASFIVFCFIHCYRFSNVFLFYLVFVLFLTL